MLAEIPEEILGNIVRFLPHSDLNVLLHSCRSICTSCIRQLWKCPRIPPLAEAPAWSEFLDTLALSSYTSREQNKKSLLPSREFYFPYVEYVESIEDIWLFIGGEHEPFIDGETEPPSDATKLNEHPTTVDSSPLPFLSSLSLSADGCNNLKKSRIDHEESYHTLVDSTDADLLSATLSANEDPAIKNEEYVII